MDENDQSLFHPVNDLQENKNLESKSPIVEHFQTHYRKHLFGLGLLSGIALFKLMSIMGSYLGITTLGETTSAGYNPSLIESAIQTFDQIEIIARQRDAFFHQEGKIYSYTGEILFSRLDAMFHILDKRYLLALDTEEKFTIAQKLYIIIDAQNKLFQTVQDDDPEISVTLQKLGEAFQTLQKEIQTE